MKRWLRKLLLPLMCLTGLALLLYPQVSNLWNRRTSSQAIAGYREKIIELEDESYAEELLAATEYNQELSRFEGYQLPDEMLEQYNRLLNITGSGIMGYLEIPSIDVTIPIYHGTDPGILQVAVGHIEWTSLPVGGAGTHCAVCGHRGLSSARLFTDLPKLELGDLFYVRVLDELLTYEVDQVRTVLPYELDLLKAERGKDYFTLMTCTPYGINSHRLLVRGHRIANSEEGESAVFISSEATEIEPMIVAPFIALPFLLLLLLPRPKAKRINRGKT